MNTKLPLNQVEHLRKLPVEEIEWEDHYSTDGWTHTEDEDLVSPVYVTSLGYRLKETKTKIVLIGNKATNGQIFGTITILKKTVRTRTVVREAP